MGVVTETNTECEYVSSYGHVCTGFVFGKVESAGRNWQDCRSYMVELRLLRKWAETAAVQQLFSTTNAADNDPWWNKLLIPYANLANLLVFY